MHPHDAIHQLAVRQLAHVLHPVRLGEIQGQWLFAEDVFPELCGTTRPFAMERGRKRNINGVDVGLLQQVHVAAVTYDRRAGGKKGKLRICGGVTDRVSVDPVSGAGLVAAGDRDKLRSVCVVDRTADFRCDTRGPENPPADGTCGSSGDHLWYIPTSSPSVRMCPFIAASSPALSAPGSSVSGASSAYSLK